MLLKLPRTYGRFVARADALATLRSSFVSDDVQMVTLVGGPGVGKTRTAQEFSWELVNQEASPVDAIWFFDLTRALDLDEALSVIGETLDVAPEIARPPHERLLAIVERLRRVPRSVLIFDECGHLPEVARELAGLFVDFVPDSFIVATSETRLRVARENVVELAPLSREASLELFEARAHGDTAWHGSDDALESLLELLQGNPLILEVVAPRIVAGALAADFHSLRARVDHPGAESIVGGSSEVLGWVWERLSSTERTGLLAFSLLPHPMTQLMARRVFASLLGVTEGIAEQVLKSLRDQSLVEVTELASDPPIIRFGLHASVREHVCARLASSESAQRWGHAVLQTYVDFARRTESRFSAFSKLEGATVAAERANLEYLAERWMGEAREEAGWLMLLLQVVNNNKGPINRNAELLERILDALVPDGDRSLRARLCLLRGRIKNACGEAVEARRCFDEGITLAREDGAKDIIADGKLQIGRQLHGLGEIEEAERWLDEATQEARHAGHSALDAEARSVRGTMRMILGRTEDAQEDYHEAAHIFSRVGMKGEAAKVWASIANLAISQMNYGEAARYIGRALANYRELCDVAGEAHARNFAGLVDVMLGEHESADRHLDRAVELHQYLGFRHGLGSAYLFLGMLRLEQSRARDAERLFSRALETHRGTGKRAEAFDEAYLGIAALEQGLFPSAARRLHAACETLVEVRDKHYSALFYPFLAAALGCLQKPAQAEDVRARALSLHADASGEVAALVHVSRAFDEVAYARQCRQSGDERNTIESLDRACRYVGGEMVGERVGEGVDDDESIHVRILRRAARSAIDASAAAPVARMTADWPTIPRERMVVRTNSAHSWFEVGAGDRQHLRRRDALHRLFGALCAARDAAPGVELGTGKLHAASWPDDEGRADWAEFKVSTALGLLRSMGLEEVLCSTESGSYLDPGVEIEVVG